MFEQVSLAAQAMVPTFDVLDGTSPEDAARLVRAQWKMPIGPVRNLVGWLEAAGCLVFEEDFGTHRIDGMSQWIGDHPVMLLNSEVPADRQRLTKAHELGHLVLHSNEPSDSMEEEANSFAAEFLMPEAVIRSSLRDVSLGHLQELKREWGVSMQALFERSYRLGFVSSVDRTRFYKAMNARGWKANEPGGEYVPRETPRLALHIGDELLARGYSREEIANIAGYRSTQGCPFVPHGGGLRVVQ
ncbi:MAG: ImmA/IrrE family metallo-endopeptidase [Actinomycetota bacterium]|nr:ImmA/IrrE family metallo-endopeptidase [Actinomycetota bacterium]